MQGHAPAVLSSEMEAPTTYSWTLSAQQGAQSESIKYTFAMLASTGITSWNLGTSAGHMWLICLLFPEPILLKPLYPLCLF